jgi:hypothetical protein
MFAILVSNARIHIRLTKVTYGIQVKDENDPWISLCEEAVEIFGRITVPGAFMVDSLPFRESHIPITMS